MERDNHHPPATQKPRVIVVDDDPIYLRVWEKVFWGIADCHYCLTNDPVAVLALLKETPVDLIISDIVMGTHSGYDIASAVHKEHPEVQLLLTTGYDCNIKRFALENPQFHILYKPYQNITNIQRFVQHLLRRENVFEDTSEDSFSENEHYPNVMEWRL